MVNFLKRHPYKYLYSLFAHESDCYRIKTGKCILEIFTEGQIKSLPFRKGYDGDLYLLTDLDELQKYKNSENSEVIQALISYLSNSTSKYRCLETAYSILINEYKDNLSNYKIDLELYPDGHYKVENGRHRFCIASKLKIPMVAHFETIGLFDDRGFIK